MLQVVLNHCASPSPPFTPSGVKLPRKTGSKESHTHTHTHTHTLNIYKNTQKIAGFIYFFPDPSRVEGGMAPLDSDSAPVSASDASYVEDMPDICMGN